ncbi:MAG: Cupredoxin-like domain [Actinomycetota bacterium]|jgi:plastocyanin
MTQRRLLAVVLLVALAAAGCGKKSEVGTGVDLNKVKGGGTCRVGECTTTTAPPVTAAPTTAKPAAPVTRAPAVTAAPTVKNTQPAAAGQTVSITASGFEPPNVRLYLGQTVKYTNADSQARSVQANDGSFSSGDLAPGASWTFTGSRPGRWDISDGSRPFVVGSIEVLAR